MGPRPLVIAHRGASAYAPDNSAEAIELARLQGADGVEVDVRVTSDGELVLSHDARHPNLEKPLIEATLADISSAGAPLLRLDEVPALLGDMLLNLEVKNHPRDPDFDPEDRVAMRVADWIAAYGLRGRTLVSSFNPATVAAVLRSDPE
ncbi:MAG: glycerophosphodiester phosphodiesterase, partial [Actinobacteria bacterium]|nr:glycerophosphodiester phosphodiesterase [Actinomycetota bacterium]NIU20742.1 glycerophosphodiester phosphodiesterase [Actinomycetota bacterium]